MDPAIYKEFAELEQQHWWFVARRKYISGLIEKFVRVSSNSSFCEVGAGTGGNLGMLSSFARVDAIEMHQDALDYINKSGGRGARTVAQGYLPDNIGLDKTYSAVFALDVIEHVEDERNSLSTLMSLVEPGGNLILTVPAYQWLWTEHDDLNHHHRRYNRQQLEAAVSHLDADVLYTSYFNTILFPLALLQRLTAKFTKQSGSLKKPPNLINQLLKRLFELESLWAGRLAMPFGLSIAIVLRRRTLGEARADAQ